MLLYSTTSKPGGQVWLVKQGYIIVANQRKTQSAQAALRARLLAGRCAGPPLRAPSARTLASLAQPYFVAPQRL